MQHYLVRLALLVTAVSALYSTGHSAQAMTLRVAATNRVYADIAGELGGSQVRTQLWTHVPKPTQACPAAVDIIIYGGTAGEPARSQVRHTCPKTHLVIRMHDLINHALATDTALWYRPVAVPHLANVLTAEYIRLDPAHRRDYVRSLGTLMQRLQPAYREMAQLRQRVAGLPVIVRGTGASSLARALSLNTTHTVSQHEDGLPLPQGVRAVVYDKPRGQAAPHIVSIAHRAGLPAFDVAVSEPINASYPTWLLHQLKKLGHVLEAKKPLQ